MTEAIIAGVVVSLVLHVAFSIGRSRGYIEGQRAAATSPAAVVAQDDPAITTMAATAKRRARTKAMGLRVIRGGRFDGGPFAA